MRSPDVYVYFKWAELVYKLQETDHKQIHYRLLFVCVLQKLEINISWTLMHYGQYKQVALMTPSNACYARSPKPIWASKRNRGHQKRRHNNRQFKIHAHIEWQVTYKFTNYWKIENT